MDFSKFKAFLPYAISAGAGVVGVAAGYYLGHDNPIEQFSEKIIERNTGLQLDLSPGN